MNIIVVFTWREYPCSVYCIQDKDSKIKNTNTLGLGKNIELCILFYTPFLSRTQSLRGFVYESLTWCVTHVDCSCRKQTYLLYKICLSSPFPSFKNLKLMTVEGKWKTL